MTNDITKVIKKAEICEGTSKSGSKYEFIKLTLINNGEERIFLNQDSKFKWNNAIDQLNGDF